MGGMTCKFTVSPHGNMSLSTPGHKTHLIHPPGILFMYHPVYNIKKAQI
jgi:hypothetical protein